jgi:hypothetical protein
MREKTTQRYIRTITQLIAFTLRAELERCPNLDLRLTPLVSGKARQLLSALLTKTAIPEAIHELVIAILSSQRALNDQFKCPGSLFIIFRNVKLSGQIKDVEDIRALMSEMRWPLRCAAFWEMILRIKATDDVENVDLFQ